MVGIQFNVIEWLKLNVIVSACFQLAESGLGVSSSFSRPEPLGAITSDDVNDPGIHLGKQRFSASVLGSAGDVGMSLDAYHASGTS
jgi:hypothetical protein